MDDIQLDRLVHVLKLDIPLSKAVCECGFPIIDNVCLECQKKHKHPLQTAKGAAAVREALTSYENNLMVFHMSKFGSTQRTDMSLSHNGRPRGQAYIEVSQQGTTIEDENICMLRLALEALDEGWL